MRFGLPVQRDAVGVGRESLLIRVVVVIELRGEVDEHRPLVSDHLETMPAVTRNTDGFLVVFADDECVQFALGRRILAFVVDADFDAALRADKVVNLSAGMAVPRADDARVRERVVGHRRLGVVHLPVLAEGLDEVSAFVGVDLEVARFDTVDLSHFYNEERYESS